MNYKEINEILKDLVKLRNQTPVESKKLNSDEAITEEIYSTPIVGVFVKLVLKMDSYGADQLISSIEFVQPKQISVTNYEPIN